jgi:HAD superfamily phosphoserine phosphatase-like hydrolase
MIVFVDFDGTITDVDTFDALARDAISAELWAELDADLIAGRRTLRDVLATQAAQIRKSEREALAFVEAQATVDPAFKPFVRAAFARDVDIAVLSSGLAPIIRAMLAREGLNVPIFANEVEFDPDGWKLRFIDDSANGHDKAATVRRAGAAGRTSVFVGDGLSDFAAAHEADRCFAKSGRALERYCRTHGLRFTPFESFAEIQAALFSGP